MSADDEAPPLPKSQPPPFSRSASTGDNPDFFDSDIDDFIAKLVIPPPPGESNDDYASPGPLANTWSGPASGIDLMDEMDDLNYSTEDIDKTVDDIFASLIIPPPPGEASEEIETLPIVPPVNSLSESNDGKRRISHRRSSSVDMSLLKFSKDSSSDTSPFGSKNNSNTGSREHVDRTDTNSTVPPSGILRNPSENSKWKNGKNRTSGSEFESPASVSEKLSSLLQMIPNFGNVDESGKVFRRTSSLRLNKTSSLELSVAPANVPPVESDKNTSMKRTDSFQTKAASVDNLLDTSSDKENRSADTNRTDAGKSEESKRGSIYSRHLRRTNSFDFTQQNIVKKDEQTEKSVDSFSSLKSKLQSYRDFLLNKSNSTKKERNTEKTSYGDSDTEPAKSPLKRSNSFTFSFLKRRSNSTDSEEGSDKSKNTSSDQASGRSRQKDKKSSSKKEKSSKENSEKEKRAPALLNTLATSRTFRPSSMALQVMSYLPLQRYKYCQNLFYFLHQQFNNYNTF